MKLAVHFWNNDPFSLSIYRDRVLERLPDSIMVLPFRGDELPDRAADLIWEPGLAGARTPPDYFLKPTCKVVATVHGAAPFVLPANETYTSRYLMLRGAIQEWRCLRRWNQIRKNVTRIIAVSNYGANEVSSVFKLDHELIHPIYHGVDRSVFNVEGKAVAYEKPYFLLVAQYQPKKNIDRVFAAYKEINTNGKPDLVAIIPGYQGKESASGIRILRDKVDQETLAKWYRGALAFVFPSLHETFGLPIIEAMACGCPVITSNGSACKEVAGEAAILVDPRSTMSIKGAMVEVWQNQSRRLAMVQKSIQQATRFTWDASANMHLKVFQNCLTK